MTKKHIFTQGDENKLKLIMCGILYLSFNDSHCHEALNACAFTKYMRKTNYRKKKCKTDEENNGLNRIFASDTNLFCLSTFHHQFICFIGIQFVDFGVEIGHYVYLFKFFFI